MTELRWMMVLSLALGSATAWAQAVSNAPPGSARVTTTPAPLPTAVPVPAVATPAPVQRSRAPVVTAPVAPSPPVVQQAGAQGAATAAPPAVAANGSRVEAAPVAPALAAHGLPPAPQAGAPRSSKAVPSTPASKSTHRARHGASAPPAKADRPRTMHEPRLRPDPPPSKLAAAPQEAEKRGHRHASKTSKTKKSAAKAATDPAHVSPPSLNRSAGKAHKGRGVTGEGAKKTTGRADGPRAKAAGEAAGRSTAHRRRNDGSQP